MQKRGKVCSQELWRFDLLSLSCSLSLEEGVTKVQGGLAALVTCLVAFELSRSYMCSLVVSYLGGVEHRAVYRLFYILMRGHISLFKRFVSLFNIKNKSYI